MSSEMKCECVEILFDAAGNADRAVPVAVARQIADEIEQQGLKVLLRLDTDGCAWLHILIADQPH